MKDAEAYQSRPRVTAERKEEEDQVGMVGYYKEKDWKWLKNPDARRQEAMGKKIRRRNM